MAKVVVMPKLGYTQDTGSIAAWLKSEGDNVEKGEPGEDAKETESYDYDVVVIGAGPGGYETAIKAAQLGKKTAIVEEKYFGGTCLNVGCIPTKVLIHTADVISEVKEAASAAVTGVDAAAVGVDMKALQQRKKSIVGRLTGGVQALLRANGVTIENGRGSFIDHHTVAVGDKKITSENIIIASGSSVFIPPFIALEGENNILTSNEALELDYVPERIAVIGGGVIGVEFAYLLNKLGAKVTVLELMDHIIPMVDPEISSLAQKKMEKDGITFHLGAKVKSVKDNHVFFELDGKEQEVAAEAVLMAVGRIPNTEGLGAEKIGLEFNKRTIAVNEKLQTNIPNIYAIGDVNGKVMLAHTASHEGMVAVANICGEESKMDYEKIPSCIYINPEISAVGLTEAAAKEKYDNVKVGRFPMMANGKSLIVDATDGMVKVILEGETGEILGVHIYADRATEMIGEASVAMTNELTAEELIHTIHAHPTVSEAIGEAFMAGWNGKAINNL